MDDKQLSEFQDKLLAKRDELTSGINRNEEQLHQQLCGKGAERQHVDFNHPADMVGGDPDYDKELTLLNQEHAELEAIGKALERIASGRYGICERCNREISLDRLAAIPYTQYCVQCQQDVEHEQQSMASA